MTPTLELDQLSIRYATQRGDIPAVRNVSVTMGAGEIVGLVGESGSGKTAIALAVLGLLPATARPRITGRILLDGRDLVAATATQVEAIRREFLAYVPQEPMSALNPTLRVEKQIELVQRARLPGTSRAQRRTMAVDALRSMELDDPERVLGSYPFQLSGGQVQRVLLATAFLAAPRLLIADEPTTALDPTVQAEVLRLLGARAREQGTSVLFISHNLGIVSQLCDRVVVMRHGEFVETGASDQVMWCPRHAYTQALLASLPGRSPVRAPLPAGAA
jgi:ABC-type glutathione transport system ATPase component